MTRSLRLLIVTLLMILSAGQAIAHTRSESFSSWLVDGERITVGFTVSDLESKRLTPDGTIPTDAVLLAYLAPKIGAEAAGNPCPEATPPQKIAVKPGLRRFEFRFACRSPDKIILHDDAFFDLVPTHVNLAQIRTANGDFVEQLLSTGQRTLDLSGAGGQNLENAGFFQFVAMGIMHIFTGPDHQSFLLGLVLISRRVRDLVFVVTGFTLGHSLTLALAVTGIIRPHAEFIDALVALTIILIGVENIAVAARKPVLVAATAAALLLFQAGLRLGGIGLLPPALLIGASIFTASYLMISGTLRDAGRLRLIVTLIFGLIHGFGFASDLLDNELPTGRLAELLLGFNLGVEIGQLSLVAAVITFVFALSRLRLNLPRPIVVDCAASFLVAVGMTWFISRSFA